MSPQRGPLPPSVPILIVPVSSDGDPPGSDSRTARAIREIHGADHLMTVRRNAPEACETLTSINRERDATGHFEEDVVKARGRIEQRRIEVLTPLPGLINCPHAAQILRVTRKRTDARRNGTGKTSIGHAGTITSAPAERASPEELLAWNRGHRSVEVSRHVRDTRFDEDACLARTGFAPGNNAPCNNIALALIIRRAGADRRGVASATRHFALRREDACAAIFFFPSAAAPPRQPASQAIRAQTRNVRTPCPAPIIRYSAAWDSPARSGPENGRIGHPTRYLPDTLHNQKR